MIEYCYRNYLIPSQGNPNFSIFVSHNHLYKKKKIKLRPQIKNKKRYYWSNLIIIDWSLIIDVVVILIM